MILFAFLLPAKMRRSDRRDKAPNSSIGLFHLVVFPAHITSNDPLGAFYEIADKRNDTVV